MLSLYKKLKIYLNPSWTIQTGIVRMNGIMHYVVTAINKQNDNIVLKYGHDIEKNFLLFPPIAVHTPCNDITVSYITGNLNKDNPDNWLDQNEERIIPPGFSSDQVLTEWDIQDNTIYSATITKESFKKFF